MIRTLLALSWLVLAVSLSLADEKKDKAKSTDKVDADEKGLLELLNKARAKAKLPALTVNKTLAAVARKHNENMAKHKKVSHVLDGKAAKDRVTAAGYDYLSVGENLAWVEGDIDSKPPTPAYVHDLWMKSKVHKANILASKYTEVGISKYKGPKGDYYYTQVFGRPRKR